MQFSFLGFSTEKIMEFKLDVKDIVILKYFNDFRNTGKMSYEIVKGEKYYWISYQNIENELPFLGLAKRAIMARMLKMKKFGILKHYTKKDGGTFSYYALGERFNELLFTYPDKDRFNEKNNSNKDSMIKNDNDINQNHTSKYKDNKDTNKENINSYKESCAKDYEGDSEVDELEEVFKFNSKSKNIKENIKKMLNNSIQFNEDIFSDIKNKSIHFYDESINKKEAGINNYDKDMQNNKQKGMLFNEFESENAQGLAVDSDRGCALKERTKTNILNNNKTIVTNIYNNINNKVYNNIKDIVSNILNYLNERVGVNYKTTNTKIINLIKLRLKEGFTVEDFKTVVDKKMEGWKGTSFEQYLNPFTLFGDKFELYLNQKVVKNQDRNKNSYSSNYRQPRKLRFDNFTGRTYDYDKLEKQLLGWE